MSLASIAKTYPPELSEEHILSLIAQIKDWQLNHGSILKLVETEDEHTVLSHPIGVSLWPTLFPRTLFHQAVDLQDIYSRLYCAIAEDEEWLLEVTKELIPVDPLASVLWGIHKEVGSIPQVSAGVFRSDYMLQVNSDPDGQPELTLKQVEFNAYSCAGGSHANKVADMHRYLCWTGVYNYGKDDAIQEENPIKLSALPSNNTIKGIASCLADAHIHYGKPRSSIAAETAVLFIVQPNNFNIADERPIEYALWNEKSSVPAHRLEFGQDVLSHTYLTHSRELLFNPPWLGSKKPLEISVVYMRAGYEAEEYDTVGRAARIQLESSAAIKCPSLLSHISTFKKVQQALCIPGALERFLPSDQAARIRNTFVPIYPLDESHRGREACRLATNPETARDYILKPSLEGGGHNVYGDAIPNFLASIPKERWHAYILMERIRSPNLDNVLMSRRGIFAGRVISELGIFGTCLWKRNPSGADGHRCDMIQSAARGWSFKTKDEHTNEMSVVKGYGCFDTPCLVDF